VNLVDREARPAQNALLELVRQHPDATLRETRRLCLPARRGS